MMDPQSILDSFEMEREASERRRVEDLERKVVDITGWLRRRLPALLPTSSMSPRSTIPSAATLSPIRRQRHLSRSRLGPEYFEIVTECFVSCPERLLPDPSRSG